MLALRTHESSTFDLLLDHDFGWDDGLICGGKVFGIILPNAQAAGETFWSNLAERTQTSEWGVTQNFEIERTDSDCGKADLLYHEIVSPPALCGLPGQGTLPRRSLRWLSSWILP